MLREYPKKSYGSSFQNVYLFILHNHLPISFNAAAETEEVKLYGISLCTSVEAFANRILPLHILQDQQPVTSPTPDAVLQVDYPGDLYIYYRQQAF
jgi:hypothetical protein